MSSTLGVTCVRGAYAKREHKMLLAETLEDNRITSQTACSSSTEPVDMGIQTAQGNHATAEDQDAIFKQTQVKSAEHPKVKKRNKKVWVHESHFVRHRGTQASCEVRHVSTQCNMELVQGHLEQLPKTRSAADHDPPRLPMDCDSDSDMDDGQHTSDYQPSSTEDTDCEEFQSEEDMLHSSEPKYIVYQHQLMELFHMCTRCAEPALTHHTTRGSLVHIEQECSVCGFRRTWESQPYIRNIPAGNLLMSSALLFSGSLPSKVFLFLEHMGVKAVSQHTFFDHQRSFLHPAIEKIWGTFQAKYVDECRQRGHKLTLGGDGRADTPGHSAKYGTYTVMDLDLLKVVDVQTVQSNDAGNSNLMEKMGFLQSLGFFDDMELEIMEFVSDRHSQIVKYMRENRPHIVHSIDVWHVAKGSKLSSKLEEVLSSRQLTKDIPMLSTGPQTATIETFHGHVNRFAPKMFGFHYEGISHRVVLAALDFNENSQRDQATRSDGKKRFNLSFTKAKKNFSLQEIKVERTYRYVKCLLDEVGNLASQFFIRQMEAWARDGPGKKHPLCTAYDKPDTDETVANKVSRYCSRNCTSFMHAVESKQQI